MTRYTLSSKLHRGPGCFNQFRQLEDTLRLMMTVAVEASLTWTGVEGPSVLVEANGTQTLQIDGVDIFRASLVHEELDMWVRGEWLVEPGSLGKDQ